MSDSFLDLHPSPCTAGDVQSSSGTSHSSVVRAPSQGGELAWSASRQSRFNECARAHYFATEVAPNGWQRDASALARTVRALKTLTSLEMQLGIALHERAAERARALREGGAMPSLVNMKQRLYSHLRHVWISSRDRQAEWRKNPRQVPMLAAAYFGRMPSEAHTAMVREKLERSASNTIGLDLWSELAACRPEDILTVDALSSYELPDPHPDGDPVKVWASPDLIFRADERVHIVDYKSGTLRDAEAYHRAVFQLIGYAVFLRHSAKVLTPTEGCQGRLIMLGDGTEYEIPISAEDIDLAEQRIRVGAATMRDLTILADAAAVTALDTAARGADGLIANSDEIVERARRAVYPMTLATRICTTCCFRELCEDEPNGERDLVACQESA